MDISIIVVLSYTLLILYVFLLLIWIYFSTFSNPSANQKNVGTKYNVSIIVPVRNEADNIIDCLNSILNTTYPKSNFEIIISDDHSEDNTIQLIKKYLELNQSVVNEIKFQIIDSDSSDEFGKKAAIERAIYLSEFEIIITTDADCQYPKDWIETMVKPYINDEVKMVAGPVKLNNSNLFEKFQSIEQAILTNITFASIRSGLPMLCNGANLSFKKSAFMACKGYSYGINFPGGDDTFLMLSINNKFPGSIRFVSGLKSLVSTAPSKNIIEYFQQRLRHAAKVSGYNEKYIIGLGVLLSSVNLLVLFLLVFSILSLVSWKVLTILLLTKLLIDFIFGLISILKTNQLNLVLYLLPSSLIYPFNILSIALMSFRSKMYSWKGRTY